MEPASFETGASSSSSSSSPARHDGAKAATGPHHGTSVQVVSPPYWKLQHQHQHQHQHQRDSYLSTYSADGHPTPISLEDHTDEGSEHCKVLWAKGVTIDDYVVVSGSAPGLGAYVVWNCTVETLDVSSARMTLVLQAARQSSCRDLLCRHGFMRRARVACCQCPVGVATTQAVLTLNSRADP